MIQKKKLIVGNWKMNPVNSKEAVKMLFDLQKSVMKLKKTEVVVCPPVIFLPILSKISKKPIQLGMQNTASVDSGAKTGELSLTQAKEYKVSYVIIGHSECRLLGETNTEVASKVAFVLKCGVTPVLCVGEKTRDQSHAYLQVVADQLKESLIGIQKAKMKDVIVAYEPIWAIGKDATRVASPEESREMIVYMKKILSDLYGQSTVSQMRFLYGGSSDEKNAEVFLRDGGVDGLLPGRASLDYKKMQKMIAIAESL